MKLLELVLRVAVVVIKLRTETKRRKAVRIEKAIQEGESRGAYRVSAPPPTPN